MKQNLKLYMLNLLSFDPPGQMKQIFGVPFSFSQLYTPSQLSGTKTKFVPKNNNNTNIAILQ